MDLLVHVEQSVGTGGREGPGSCRTCGDAGGQGGVFALHRDVFGLHLPGFDELGEFLGERGLWRDGVGGDHLDSGELHSQCSRHVAVLDHVHGLGPSNEQVSGVSTSSGLSVSSTMVMALVGHSSAQMAQPLQYS